MVTEKMALAPKSVKLVNLNTALHNIEPTTKTYNIS